MQEFQSAVDRVKDKFKFCHTSEQTYAVILSMGNLLPYYPAERKTKERLVAGCQSLMYIDTYSDEGLFMFTVDSDALISKGLAAILYEVYNSLPLDVVVKNPPHFLKDWGLLSSLSPSRSKGVVSLYVRMQQEAIKLLASSNKSV